MLYRMRTYHVTHRGREKQAIPALHGLPRRSGAYATAVRLSSTLERVGRIIKQTVSSFPLLLLSPLYLLPLLFSVLLLLVVREEDLLIGDFLLGQSTG